MSVHSLWASVVWASIATRSGSGDLGEHPVELVLALDEVHRLRRHGQRARRFVVAAVADVEDRVALARPDLGLVVHLGDERAHRVDDVATFGAGRGHHVGCRAVRRQHQRRARRHLGDVVDEDHTLVLEPLDHEPVVHDLVVAVDGRLERADHPCEGLDRHLHARAEAPGFGEQHLLDSALDWPSTRPSVRIESHGTATYNASMPPARVVAVAPGSPAAGAGLDAGDEVVSVNGDDLRDVISYQLHVDGPHVELEVRRGGLERSVVVEKADGAPLGIELESAVFDRVRTCDNHCPFCFIHQLPKGMRKSLSLKDDDYRLSFLYGNFTTLTRFTEADLERVVTERLGPLYVSIHATDPDVRTRLLRNRRGATSLRWLELLLDAGIEVHGQVVVCPGINDGAVLDDTLLGVLDRFPTLATLGVVPLGVSAHNREPEMRPHTPDGGGRRSRRARPLAGAIPSGDRAAGSCSPPTSTTCSPDATSPRSTRTTVARNTRTGSAWPEHSKRRCGPPSRARR